MWVLEPQKSLPSTWKAGVSSADQVPRGINTGGGPCPPPLPGTYRQGRLQSIPRYHLHGQARLRENLDCFLHASPGRVDDSDETQKRQLPQLGPGGQGQHCGQSRKVWRTFFPRRPWPPPHPCGAGALSSWTTAGREDIPRGPQAHAGQQLLTAHPRWGAGPATTCPMRNGTLSTGGVVLPKGSGQENICGWHMGRSDSCCLSLLCPSRSLPADLGWQLSSHKKGAGGTQARGPCFSSTEARPGSGAMLRGGCCEN